jgi:hypothetical protein
VAHKIRIYKVPHLNKDGSVSKSKVAWLVRCKSRKGQCRFETFTTKKAAEQFVTNHRNFELDRHAGNNPRDIAHQKKHEYGAASRRREEDQENVA